MMTHSVKSHFFLEMFIRWQQWTINDEILVKIVEIQWHLLARDHLPIQMVPLIIQFIRIGLRWMLCVRVACGIYVKECYILIYFLAIGCQIVSKNSLNFLTKTFHLLGISNSDWFINMFGRRHKIKSQSIPTRCFSFDGNLRNHKPNTHLYTHKHTCKRAVTKIENAEREMRETDRERERKRVNEWA